MKYVIMVVMPLALLLGSIGSAKAQGFDQEPSKPVMGVSQFDQLVAELKSLRKELDEQKALNAQLQARPAARRGLLPARQASASTSDAVQQTQNSCGNGTRSCGR